MSMKIMNTLILIFSLLSLLCGRLVMTDVKEGEEALARSEMAVKAAQRSHKEFLEFMEEDYVQVLVVQPPL